MVGTLRRGRDNPYSIPGVDIVGHLIRLVAFDMATDCGSHNLFSECILTFVSSCCQMLIHTRANNPMAAFNATAACPKGKRDRNSPIYTFNEKELW